MSGRILRLTLCVILAGVMVAGNLATVSAGRGRSEPKSTAKASSSGRATAKASPRAAQARRADPGYSMRARVASGVATYGQRPHHRVGYPTWSYFPGYYFAYPYYYWHSYWGWGWPFYYWGSPIYNYYIYGGGDDLQIPGSIETDVKPGRSVLKLNGEPVGQARDYNGNWDLLIVQPGHHLLEFSRDGYMTLQLLVEVAPGRHHRLVERLQKGEGRDPRSIEEAREDPAAGSRELQEGQGRYVLLQKNDLPRSTLRSGLLKIRVTPEDAAVYLDGEFLAQAAELNRLHGALPVAEGTHTLEVVCPGYVGRQLLVEVDGEEKVELELEPRKPPE